MDCQICRKEKVDKNVERKCAVCSSYMCRYCAQMDRGGEWVCSDDKTRLRVDKMLGKR